MYLSDRADKDSKCYPAIGTIARELKLSRRTVKRAITDLEKRDIFARKIDGGKTVKAATCNHVL